MTLVWSDLFLQTLREPASAAQIILGTRLSRRDIYLALIASAALNAVLTGVSLQLFPLPQGWPVVITNPLSYFALVAGGLLLFAYLLTLAGRTMGGDGTLDGLLKLVVWLQFVRIVLQVLGLVLTVLLPILGSLYSLAAAALSIWIVLHFIKAGHRLSSLGAAALVLFITFVGLIVGMSLLLALTGFGPLGVTPDV